MLEFESLTQKLAEIQGKLVSLVEKINAAAGGEAFYARITLENRHLTGLIENLRINQYKIIFDFTEEKLVDGQIMRKTSKKEIVFEKLRGIEPFQTLSGKHISLGDK